MSPRLSVRPTHRSVAGQALVGVVFLQMVREQGRPLFVLGGTVARGGSTRRFRQRFQVRKVDHFFRNMLMAAIAESGLRVGRRSAEFAFQHAATIVLVLVFVVAGVAFLQTHHLVFGMAGRHHRVLDHPFRFGVVGRFWFVRVAENEG